MSAFTLAQVVDKQGEAERGRTAASFGGDSVTFGELDERSRALAAGLHDAGFQQGDRLAVLMHNRLEWLEIFFALARLGGVLVPLNHLLTSQEIEYILDDSGARWLVADEALWGGIEGLPSPVRAQLTEISVGERGGLRATLDELAGDPGRLPDARVDGDDIFLLQYTSGTTGFPKGATHSHATVMWNAISQRQHFSLDDSTVYLCLPALSWVAGFHSLHLQTLWSGGRVVLNPTDRSFDPADFCRRVEAERVTTVAMVPTVLRMILSLENLADFDLSSLRLAIAGGEPVPVHLLEQVAALLPALTTMQVYGMSEFPSLATLLDPADATRKLGSAGRPNCVTQIRILDEQGADCPTGTIGEIALRSPATMLGYYGMPEETATVLRGGWLHTGDLGHLDEDGFLYISGRSKDMIISGGLNIYPAEIEHELVRHPAVAEAAVIGVPDQKWGEIAKAVVVLREGEEASERELREFVETRVARFKLPKAWQVRSGPPLPKTASGKLQKFKLVEAEG